MLLTLIAILLIFSCSQQDSANSRYADLGDAPEYTVEEIELDGDISGKDSEISGLAWQGDRLILLVQYPDRFDNKLFYVTRSQINTYLQSDDPAALRPSSIDFIAPGLDSKKGYEGLESIAFKGDIAFVTIEASPNDVMQSWLLKGVISESQLVLNTSSITVIPAQANISNFSDEALLIFRDTLYTFYEANGYNVNVRPMARRFSTELRALGDVSFPYTEYRITDVSSVDTEGRFWAANYFYKGNANKLNPAVDSLFLKYGIGNTHRESTTVERLLEFRITTRGVVPSGAAPVLLQLEKESRNWEGLVRFPEMGGFILATDTHPRTILAFVKAP